MDAILSSLLQAGLIDVDTADILRRQNSIDEARAWAENAMTTAVSGGLSAQQQRLLTLLDASDYQPTARALSGFWSAEDDLLWAAIRPTVLQVVTERATLAAVLGGQVDTFRKINENVIRWAESYYIDADGDVFGSVPNLNLHSRTIVSRAFVEWQRGELEIGRPVGLPQLIDALTPAFGIGRSAAIASTEVTRIFVQSAILAEENNSFSVAWRYLVSNDERTCPVCLPGAGLVTEKGATTFPDGGGFPPRHPRCRCHISVESVGSLRIPLTGRSAINGT